MRMRKRLRFQVTTMKDTPRSFAAEFMDGVVSGLIYARYQLARKGCECDPRDRANVATLLELATRTRDSLRREVCDGVAVDDADPRSEVQS